MTCSRDAIAQLLPRAKKRVKKNGKKIIKVEMRSLAHLLFVCWGRPEMGDENLKFGGD